MRSFYRALAVSTLALTLTGTLVLAQDHPDNQHQHYVRHSDWKKGAHISHDDWNRGEAVSDWQTHHLRRPPAGYEWRLVDGNYVLARPGDGLIFSVVIGH
ncbi:MAG TPA: RcnB family protein [Acidobacteriaceae bacterium]|nr:RcnB family protein [Acidobacteriaceae bacterium]